MKRFRQIFSACLISALALIICTAGPAPAQQIDQVVNQILNGDKLNANVEIYGVVENWSRQKADNTITYVIKDDWGDSVTVVATGSPPKTNKRYRVSGYVAFDPANKEYQVMEKTRNQLDTKTPPPPPPPPPEETDYQWWIIGGLAGAIGIVLIALILVLFKTRSQPAADSGFSEDSVVSVSDKTQKITAAVADQKAVEQGTVKVMPGRFEVQGGVDLKEIRLIRPPGTADHNLEYTFGRTAGDQIRHIQLNDPTVSSNQAKLRFSGGRYSLINIPDPNDPDRNATLINDRSMGAHESHTLSDQDKVQMGHVILIYHEK